MSPAVIRQHWRLPMMNQTQEPFLLSDSDLKAITGGAPINYGDFANITVTYTCTDFTESSSSQFGFFAYGASFTGGVRVAVGDVVGDGSEMP